MIDVISPGGLTTVQDLGREGLAHLGVPPSGAADRRSLMLANRLVGNPEGLAGLESTLRGPVLRFRRAALVALAGAEVDACTDDRDLAMHAPERVQAGDTLTVGCAQAGLRTYIAVRGGFEVPHVLGSASTDLLSGLGPAPLRAGDLLRVGTATKGLWPSVDVAAIHELPSEPRLRVILGPRADWFAADALLRLLDSTWDVSPDSNRIGVRLRGERLPWARREELRSEGVVCGALQVPPAGEPILLLADHPTTGGYPVIAVVATDDLPLAGQLAPGTKVRFAPAHVERSDRERAWGPACSASTSGLARSR
jgi:biotin-dependent carboxylase-like uncharacterized protein